MAEDSFDLFAVIMMSARKNVFIMAFVSVSVPCLCAPGSALRQNVKDVVHPTTLDASLGEYDRKTQSPMLWMNLHKTDLSSTQSLKAASFLGLFSATEGLHKQGVTGDPSPPPNPVVNVHVSEPAMGADDFSLAMAAHQHEHESLLKLEERIASVEEQTLATMKGLAQEVRDLSDVINFQMQA